MALAFSCGYALLLISGLWYAHEHAFDAPGWLWKWRYVSFHSSWFSLILPSLNTNYIYMYQVHLMYKVVWEEISINRSQAKLSISNDVLPPPGSAFILDLSHVLLTWGQQWKELCSGDARRSLCPCSQRTEKSNRVACASRGCPDQQESWGRVFPRKRRESGPAGRLLVVVRKHRMLFQSILISIISSKLYNKALRGSLACSTGWL